MFKQEPKELKQVSSCSPVHNTHFSSYAATFLSRDGEFWTYYLKGCLPFLEYNGTRCFLYILG